MFDTIITRRKKPYQRLLAGVLSFVLTFMCLPLQAFASSTGPTQGVDYRGIPQRPWTRSTEGGGTLSDKDTIASIFDSEFNRALQITGDGVTIGGDTYQGLANTNPSGLWVMENFVKALLVCNWANYNMVSDESGDYRYNVFFNNMSAEGGPGQIYTENRWTETKEQLNSVMNALGSDKFKDDYIPWGADPKTTSNYLSGLRTVGGWTNLADLLNGTDASLQPGSTLNFELFLSVIMYRYYEAQMANIIAYHVLDADEIAALNLTGSGEEWDTILNACVKKLKQTQETTPPTVVDNGSGELTVNPYSEKDAFPTTFSASGAWLMGNGAVYNSLAGSDGFDSGNHSKSLSYNTQYLPLTSQNMYYMFDYTSYGELDPSYMPSDGRYVYMAGGSDVLEFMFGQSEYNSESGTWYAYGDPNVDADLFSDENITEAAKRILYAPQNAANYLGTEDNPVGVSICAIPHTEDANQNAVIDKFNTALRAEIDAKNATENSNGVFYRFIDIADAGVGTSDTIYSAVKSAVEKQDVITGIDMEGNQVTMPNETGKSELVAADLLTLYQQCPELQEYLDSYKAIRTYVDQLYSQHYDDDSSSQTIPIYGYYWDRASYIKSTYMAPHSLLDDLLTYAHDAPIYNLSGAGQNDVPADDPNKQVDNAGDSALRLISNCDFGEDYEIKCTVDSGDENDPLAGAELSGIGYKALTGGVVYDPFVSREGNDSYMAVVLDALGGDGATDDTLKTIERFLHQALSRKKPVYVIDGKRDQWLHSGDVKEAPTGNYRFAYVADLLQGEVNATRCYTVMKGGMAPSTVDSNTWLYSQGEPRDTGENGGSRVDDEVSYRSNSTPAGSQATATSEQMSAPIMFTSGTTEGVFKGNADGSADGYAASLGGLTTVIIHNAAQDAKDNEYVKNADKYMLFMNGLGDIVLADGTIILPAIANPVIYNYDQIQYSVDGSFSIDTILAGTFAGIGVITAMVLSGGTAAVPIIIGATVGGSAGFAIGAGTQGGADLFWGETESPEVIAAYEGTFAYYPYTAAFMNHYPSTSVNVEQKLSVLNQNDKGKYVIGVDSHGDFLARKITGFNKKTQVNLQYSGGGVTCVRVQGLSFNVESDVTRIGTMLPQYGGEDGTWSTRFNTANKFEFFMCKNTAYNSNDQAFFPLEDNNDAALQESYLDRAGPMMTSAKRYLMTRHPIAESTEAFDGFNARRYICDMAGQGLMGTMYSETLQKNYQISYDELVADTGSRLLTFFVQLVESAVDSLGNIDGVLAIKNGYENKFFNLIVSFIQEFYGLIAVVLLIIVAVKFLKGHYNMLFVLFIGAICFCGFEVYANWMPTLVPNVYNFAVNDAVEQIVWNTVAVSAESYSETYKDSGRKDATTGEPKPYTATMTLYKMSQQDMRDMAARLGTTYTELKKGTVYYLDESAGIFVQGDAIKISIDKLLVNNSMRGLHQSQWQELDAEFSESDNFITPITRDSDMVANPYTVQITNPYVSLEAYYMPFNEIERAFLIQLNKFSSMFRMEHNVYSYGRNLYKDSFLFNNYTNSGIFTAPGNKEVLTENIRIGSIVSRYTDPERALNDFLYRIYGNEGDNADAVFPVPEDWLGVAAVFRSPSENFKDSLWGKAMQRKGWYDENWNIINPDKLNDLIYYMNTQTKQFVIANSDQLNFCSDENAIKIVAMYVTTTFTHYTSEFGGWLYPNYVNAADISLKDALYGSMTTLKDRNFSYDGTVVNTVAKNLGVFGVIFILLITVFACVFVFVMTYLVPILYAMFGGIIVFKLINNSNSVGLVKGYVKVTTVTAILYFIFSLSMRLVEVGGYAWYGYLGCALLMFLCCYFLFWVVLSVIQNAGEMGNDVLGQNLLRGLDHITHGAVRKLTASNLTANRMNRGYNGRNTFLFSQHAAQYGRGYGVDSWDYIRGDRSRYGYSRYSDVYNEYGHDSLYEGRESRLPFFGRRQSRYEDRRTAQRFRRR